MEKICRLFTISRLLHVRNEPITWYILIFPINATFWALCRFHGQSAVTMGPLYRLVSNRKRNFSVCSAKTRMDVIYNTSGYKLFYKQFD